jgi:hypothetical protein
MAVVGAVLAIPPIRKRLQQKPIFRAGLFIFGVIPLLLALIGSVTVLPQRYQLIASSIGHSRHSVPAARGDVIPLHRGPKSKPPQRFPG